MSWTMCSPLIASPIHITGVYAFILNKKVAVPAAILFCSILMAAAKISASGAPTNVIFPPLPIHWLTAFHNDYTFTNPLVDCLS